MSLPDTAEYWQDVKKQSNKFVFTHIKGKECGHFHVSESKELDEIDCYACKKIIESDKELKSQLEKNNGARYNQHRKKKGFRLSSQIKFGKYKGKTIQFIIDNDLNYFNWVKNRLLLHPEFDNISDKIEFDWIKKGVLVSHEDYTTENFIVDYIQDGIVYTIGGKNGTWSNPIELIIKPNPELL